jgi:dihydrofolate reductase
MARLIYVKNLSTTKTRLERTFDPASLRDLKASATSDLTGGGPHLAAHALKAGLVEECHLLIHPVLVGGGKPALPDDVRADLEHARATITISPQPSPTTSPRQPPWTVSMANPARSTDSVSSCRDRKR